MKFFEHLGGDLCFIFDWCEGVENLTQVEHELVYIYGGLFLLPFRLGRVDLCQRSKLFELRYCFFILLAQHNSVLNKLLLDMEVNLANILIGHHFRLHLESCHAIVKIDVETRMVIDFQDPRFQVPIDQQIEAQYLERLALQCLFARERRHLLLD